MSFEPDSNVMVEAIAKNADLIDLRNARLPIVTPPDDGFDPRDHRSTEHYIKPWMAYFNLFKTAISAGMLGMPLAISQAGIILGPIMTVAVGLLVWRMHVSLLWSLNEISRQLRIPYVSYRYGFRIALLHGPPILHALGRCGPWIIAFFMILAQLGICTIITLLAADNLRDIMDWKSTAPALMCLYIPYVLLEMLMKNLSRVSYVAMAGNVMNAAGLILVMVAIVKDPHGELIAAPPTSVSFFFALGTILSNLSAIGVTLSCDKALKDPRVLTKRCGAIEVGTLISTAASCIFGSMGFWAFGNMEDNILRSLPLDSNLTMATFVIYLISMGMTYPLQCFPAITILIEEIRNHDQKVEPSKRCLTVTAFVVRQIFVLSSFVIAYFIPFQSTMVAFVGNLCNTLLVLVFPALMEIGILYPHDYGRFKLRLIKKLLFAMTGVIAWFPGVWAAFEAISKVIVQTIGKYDKLDIIDVRFAKLPRERPMLTRFDPRNFRTPKSAISPWMAYFNLLRNVVGTSVLGASGSISQVGFILGPVLIIMTGFLCVHTHLVLLWCLNEIARQLKIANISYRYGFRMALLHGPPCLHWIGNSGPCIIAAFMIMSQIAICALIVLYTADNLRDIADWESNTPAIIFLFFPYFFIEMFMHDLRIISKVVLIGNSLNLTGFVLVIYHIITATVPRGDDINLKPKGWIPTLYAFGTTLFNVSAVGVVISCEKALANPKIMTSKFGVVRVGMLVPAFVSVIIGSIGYYTFGGMDENILRYLPFDDPSATICIAFYMVTTALTYPLQCYPCTQIFIEVVKNHDPAMTPSNEFITGLDHVCRPVFVIITFMIAYFVPVQGPLVAFIGSFCTTMLVLVFPALMEIGICYPDHYGKYSFILIKDFLIILVGIAAWFAGVYLCGYLIYVRLQSKHE